MTMLLRPVARCVTRCSAVSTVLRGGSSWRRSPPSSSSPPSSRRAMSTSLHVGPSAHVTSGKLLGDNKAQEEESSAVSDDEKDVDYSRLFKELVWPQRRLLGVGVALNGLNSGLSLILPFAVGKMVDGSATAWKNGDMAIFDPVTAAGCLLGVFVVQSVASVFRQHVLNTAGERVAEGARCAAFQNLLTQELAFFDKSDSGELLNRLSADAAQLRLVLTSSLAQALSAVASGVGAVAMLTYLSPQLCLISLAAFPAVFLFASWRGRRMRREQKEVQESLAKATSIAQRSLLNVRTLRSLGAESALLPAYNTAVRVSAEQAVQVGWSQALFGAGVYLAANLSLLSVLGFGGHLVVEGAMSPGALSSFMMYSLYLGFATSGLSSTYADFQRATGATERLAGLIQRKSAMENNSMEVPKGGHISFRDVNFQYPTRDAPTLKSFNLDIEPGSRVAIRGSSGCGKSTVLRLLSRLYDVDGGAVTIGGTDLREMDTAALRGRLVGVVPQEPTLISGSIAENVRLGAAGREVTELQLASALEMAGLAPLMARLTEGQNTPVGEQGATLSGGEKQRVAIARLLLADPPIVLLDEFSSALDHATMVAVCANLAKALKGRTLICVVHNDAVLREIQVDRVIDLELGGAIAKDDRNFLRR